MPLLDGEEGEILEFTAVTVTDFAHGLLKAQGHNATMVWHVYGAFNGWWPGYDIILYTSYGATKRTAYVWYEHGRLKVYTVLGWFDDAAAPPEKKGPPGTQRLIAAMEAEIRNVAHKKKKG